MRSVLMVPANVRRFIERAPKTGADVVCLDLEDSVPLDQRATARERATDAIAAMPSGNYAVWVRVNGLATGMLEDDLRAVVAPRLEAILLAKADSPETVRSIDGYLTSLERERGLEEGSVAVVPLIESAAAVLDCRAICQGSPRVLAAVFGAEDLAAQMGLHRTPEGAEIAWPRAYVAIACHAAGVIPIDTPATDYTDESRLASEMAYARSLGYRGKLCIHPAQVAIANRVFSPTAEELEEARAIVEAFEREALAKGRATMSLEGKMLDTPVYLRAKRLLEWVGRRPDEQER
jgi:citrate lyase subunit beta/citryl-CoA lyase